MILAPDVILSVTMSAILICMALLIYRALLRDRPRELETDIDESILREAPPRASPRDFVNESGRNRIFDRILVVSSFGTMTVLMIAVLGFLEGRPDFLDLALVYALMNFIATIAVLRFTHYGDLIVLDQASDLTEPHLAEPIDVEIARETE